MNLIATFLDHSYKVKHLSMQVRRGASASPRLLQTNPPSPKLGFLPLAGLRHAS